MPGIIPAWREYVTIALKKLKQEMIEEGVDVCEQMREGHGKRRRAVGGVEPS